jgi:CRP-like cAMP-binding protein
MKCSQCGREIPREEEQSFAEANFGSCFDCEDKPLNFDCLSEHDLCAYLQIPNTTIRLATFAPGTIIGELAILDEGVRSATVVADTELVCRTLTTSNFAAVSAKLPSIAIRLLAAIARDLSGRLRTANRTIHQLDT